MSKGEASVSSLSVSVPVELRADKLNSEVFPLKSG
jgi:hypothetical protein